MTARKAVITAAGPRQRQLPLQTLVDRDGAPKTALRILLEEVARAGVQAVALVVHPDDAERYRGAGAPDGLRLHFVPQAAPRGYADALLCAREFVGDEPFLHLVGDHLFVPRGPTSGALELVRLAAAEQAAVCAVQPTRESQLGLYGAVGGTRLAGHDGTYVIDAVLEKPTPTVAEQRLFVPGLRAGHYLCFFGMHVLLPSVFRELEAALHAAADPTGVSLSDALARLCAQERCLAFEVNAQRFNLGEKYGLLTAQLALALAGGERDEVLAQLVELLAQRERGR